MSKPASLFAAAATAALITWGPAHATGLMRIWVSGHGTDAAGCGAPTNPCRSLQYAHDNITPGGEVDILDPAGYGAVTITKAISIVNDGVGTAGVQQATPGQDAITINADSTDAVTLRGLNIDGLGVAQNGIRLNEAGELTVVNCVIRHFAHDGMYLLPGSGNMPLTILNTIAADNANDGFDISSQSQGGVEGVIDHSAATNNGSDGVVAWGATSTVGSVLITVSNSVIANNQQYGLYAKGNTSVPNAGLYIREDLVDFDTLYGFYQDAGSTMIVTRSEFIGDQASGFMAAGTTGYTLGDNVIALVVGGPLTKLSPG